MLSSGLRANVRRASEFSIERYSILAIEHSLLFHECTDCDRRDLLDFLSRISDALISDQSLGRLFPTMISNREPAAVVSENQLLLKIGVVNYVGPFPNAMRFTVGFDFEQGNLSVSGDLVDRSTGVLQASFTIVNRPTEPNQGLHDLRLRQTTAQAFAKGIADVLKALN